MQYTLLTRGRVKELRDIIDTMGYNLIAARFVDDLGLVLIIEEEMLGEEFLIREKDIINQNILGAKKINLVDLRSTDEDIIKCLEEEEEEEEGDLDAEARDAVRYMQEKRII